MSELVLQGCTPEPMSSYLKALGILRLVAEQKDSSAKGYWQNDSFVLISRLCAEELEAFFCEEYQPTPIISPWNQDGGFYKSSVAVKEIAASESPRFAEWREAIAIAQAQIKAMGLKESPEKEEKHRLLVRLRNRLPDSAIRWLDAVLRLEGDEKFSFAPLTGLGGTDGKLEFSHNFIKQVLELIDPKTGTPNKLSAICLRAALSGEVVPALPNKGTIGRLSPLAAGGANASPEYQAKSRVNPWEYVLALEGTLLLTAAVTRRYEQAKAGELVYPFAVHPSGVGYASAALSDESAKAELWMPLWSSPASLEELKLLFSEGRAKVGLRTAATGVDFALAVSKLGVSRGLSEFVRYTIQERNGRTSFIIPVGRFQPRQNPQTDRLAEIDGWLVRLRERARSKETPDSIKRSHRLLDSAIFEFVQGKGALLDVLIALGEMEKALDRSRKSKSLKGLSPVPYLSGEWVRDCCDDTPEFRLAVALAGRQLRQRLVRVRPGKKPCWLAAEKDDGRTIWRETSLVKNLIGWLLREEIEANQENREHKENRKPAAPLSPFAGLSDIVGWMNGNVGDKRVEAIARGLSLVQPLPQLKCPPLSEPVPAAYALLEVVQRRVLPDVEQPLPQVPGLLRRLAAGDCQSAAVLAIRRLRGSGLRPAIDERLLLWEPPEKTERIAAALAFPISKKDAGYLLKQVQVPKKED